MVDVTVMRDRVTNFADAVDEALDELADLRHEAESLRRENEELRKRLMPDDWARTLGECVDLAGWAPGEAWLPERALGIIRDALRTRLMPEGMWWPRYDTGELVEMGDEVASSDDDGSPMAVDSVEFSGDTFKLFDRYNCEITDGWTLPDVRVKRPEPKPAPDSWERWREDVALVACDYCDERGIDYGHDSDAESKQVEDLERRAKALVGEVADA